MEYFSLIQSVVSYVETRVKTKVNTSELQRVTGFSEPHLRAVFTRVTRTPLARYVRFRKVSNAAFEIAHTDRNILDIALDYGFDSYDTFTRAFKRVTGITPQSFRKQGGQVGRIKLAAGIYGPGIYGSAAISPSLSKEDSFMKDAKHSCILHGVPKVEYSSGECTPFPSCLKACLNYLGQSISYSYLMAVSGAAFRLRWNNTCWDGGNVDLFMLYENPMEAYERSLTAAGRSYKILQRTPELSKDDFINFIKTEIDQGRPVIALGIIGPPEACIVAGYANDGQTLLGWNFFQDNPEFAKDVTIDQSGYFICSSWWENPCTIALMSISEEKGVGISTKEVLENAISVMSIEGIGNYSGGQKAYDAWAKALSDDSEFPENAVLPLLFERLMCQGDAMDMVGEGRYLAAKFMEQAVEQNQAISEELLSISKVFKQEAGIAGQMSKVLGGWQRGEEQARALAQPSVRKELVKLIYEAKALDAKACKMLIDVVKKI